MIEIFRNPNYNFIGQRRWAYAVSLVITVVALISLATQGLPPGPDSVFVWQRASLRAAEDLPFQRYLVERGFLVVAEMDDDPLRFPEHPASRFRTIRLRVTRRSTSSRNFGIDSRRARQRGTKSSGTSIASPPTRT